MYPKTRKGSKMDDWEEAYREARQTQKEKGMVPPEAPKPTFYPFKQMPLWPSTDRAAPSSILRSALFRVAKVHRGSFKNVTVASWPGAKITYTGIELTQTHLTAWLQIVEMTRDQIGQKVPFSINGFMKKLGRKHHAGKGERERLMDLLEDLQATSITITHKGESDAKNTAIGISLLDAFAIDATRCYVQISPVVISLFNDGYTKLGWETRRKISGNLGKWLHAYVSSHAATERKPSRIGLEKLQKLCGSEQKVTRVFRFSVRKTMSQLEELGVVVKWNLDDDVLSFVRPKKKSKAGGIQVLR